MRFRLSVNSRCIAGSFLRSVLLLALVFPPLTACRATKAHDETRPLLDRLEHEILKEPLSGKAVYILKEPLAGGTSIATWRVWGEWITDNELANLSKKIKAKEALYVMEQCYSGGMMDDLLQAQSIPAHPERTV